MTEPTAVRQPNRGARNRTERLGPDLRPAARSDAQDVGTTGALPVSFEQAPLRRLEPGADAGPPGAQSCNAILRRTPSEAPRHRPGNGRYLNATALAVLRRSKTTAPATDEQIAITDAIQLAFPQLPPTVQRFLRSLPPAAESVVMSLSLVTVKKILIGLAHLPPDQQDSLFDMDAAALRALMFQLGGATYTWRPEGAPPDTGQDADGSESRPSNQLIPRPRPPSERPTPNRSAPARPPARLKAPLLTTEHKEDGRREYTVHPTDALIEAFEADYTSSKTYLQEGEGDLLATHLNVTAEIFDQPDPEKPAIRRNYTYGTGATKGTLLYVNRNHYVVLDELPEDAPGPGQVRTDDGRRFNLGIETVSDGNCLIDGLLIISGQQSRTDEDFQRMRTVIQSDVGRAHTIEVLTGILTAMLAGEWPLGLGGATWGVLRSENDFMKLAEAERDRIQSEKAKSQSSQPPEEGPLALMSEEDLALQHGLLDSLSKPKVHGSESGPSRPAPHKNSQSTQTSGENRPSSPLVGKKHESTPAPRKKATVATKRKPRQPSSEGDLAELRELRTTTPYPGLEEKVADTREKLQGNGTSTGLPHVFNKIFAQLSHGMITVLDGSAAYAGDASAAKDVQQQVAKLHTEFEENYRKHLVADLPASVGPDENSLAFGSESSGLFHLMDECSGVVLSLATGGGSTKKETAALRNQFQTALKAIQAQMLHLVDIGIDHDAENALKKVSNKRDSTRYTGLIANAKTFLQANAALATGVLIPNFYEALFDAIKQRNSPESGSKPTGKKSPPSAKKSSVNTAKVLEEVAAFVKGITQMLDDLKERDIERRKTDNGKNPEARAAEILTDILKAWSNADAVAKLYADDPVWFRQSAARDSRIVKRVYAHAVGGRKSGVLPVEASPTNEPKAEGSQFATAKHDVVGGKGKVSFSSTNARNVVYASKDLAMAQARKMLGLADDARPHARYVLGPQELPKTDPSDIRIEMKRDQQDSNPGEGYVEEYITESGPMIIAYHSRDCNAKVLVDGKERPFAPHFHVGTLSGEVIDKEYWGGSTPEDRTPQFGRDITTTYDFDGEARKARDAKDYVQHDQDHHLYHL